MNTQEVLRAFGALEPHILAVGDTGSICGGGGGIFASLTEAVVYVMDVMGAVGIAIAILVENVIPVVPSEIILPLAGFSVTQGAMSLPVAIAVSTVCSLIGALFIYWLSQAVGIERIKKFADWFPLSSAEDVEKAEKWFKKYGSLSVFIARDVPVVRVLISVPAGLEKMPLLRFSLLTTLGSLVWNTALLLAGYLLGSNWCQVVYAMESVQLLVIAVLAVLVGVYVFFKVRKALRSKKSN
ncbi:MAG: DedA family protein [Bifidobacteriaceae bacterium]|jgi:membrane protein DedA with SNARE-associated domain|nr:DedA family protein [Bifidobacteriaceae bacterium]